MKKTFFLLFIGFSVCSCTFSSKKNNVNSDKDTNYESPQIVEGTDRIVDEGTQILDEGEDEFDGLIDELNSIIEEGKRLIGEDDETALPVIVSDMDQMNDIVLAYSSNEIKAAQLYEGKRYQLIGKVRRIVSNPEPAVVMEGTNGNDFWFYLLPSEVNRASDLSVGDNVSLSGLLSGCLELLDGHALSFNKARFESE